MPKQAFFQLPQPVRERIVAAAAETLTERGFHQATLADIAVRLEIDASFLDQYFDDIRDAIAAVVASSFQYFGALYSIVASRNGTSFWDLIERVYEFGAQRANRNRALLHIYLSIAGMGAGALTQAAYDRFESRAALFFQNLALTGVKEKALRADVDPTAMAMHFQTTMRFLMSRRVYPLYRARSKAYFPDAALDAEGDQQLRTRMIAHLRKLYGTA